MAVIHRLYGANISASGVARMPVEELEKLLGPSAAHVWAILRSFRDHNCETHATVAGISRARGFVSTRPRVTKKALARLRQAGLVHDVGWRVQKVPFRRRTKLARVYVREVYGQRAFEKCRAKTYKQWEEWEPTEVYIVPIETKKWAESACYWGGARKGAGRPRKSAKPLENKSRGAEVVEFKRVHRSIRSIDQDLIYPPSPSEKVGAHARQPDFSIESETSAGENQTCDYEEACVAKEPIDRDFDQGAILGGGATTASPSSTTTPGVPPRPIVEPARVPPPPLLDPSEPEGEQAARLLAAYRAAVEKRTKQPCKILSRRGALEKSRHYKTLVSAAKLMVEHEIAPAAWCLFMIDVFHDYAIAGALPATCNKPKSARPTLPWVFAPAKIKRWRGWFGRDAHAYGGGRLIFGNLLKELLRDYEKMRRDLHKYAGDDVQEIVQRWFPPERSFEQRVEEARREAEATRGHLEQRVRRGDILWG